jgi:hypothetical protein
MAKGLLILCLIATSLATANASPASDKASAGLASVYQLMDRDVAEGRPIVMQVHVPLCETEVLACGNPRLGDGDNPRTNLYWSTSGGVRGWFLRKGTRGNCLPRTQVMAQ